ncbi:unnamed protein product [Eruca vesicaria subsp. sativa]|uniref:Uncharacterized protein n=1 Tax=Eruca vesicaria subsp. sativa TaxID=29727 RepID=A0ABC8K520_ERUVS|nr:unnamed protein product [Eruca vesicaria subsp. sativa]
MGEINLPRFTSPMGEVTLEEFEVEQEEKDAYWDALCGSVTPPAEVFFPKRPTTVIDLTVPSRTSSSYLSTLQEFYKVTSGLGKDLSPDDFEGLWATRKTGNEYSCCLHPKKHMSIIQGHTSNSMGERVRPRKDKGIAFRIVSEDPLIPGWETGNGSGASEAPLPNDFFDNLPPGFTTQASLTEASRREVVAEGSRLINEVWSLNFFEKSLDCYFLFDLRFVHGTRVLNSALDGGFREACLSHFKAEEIERKFIEFHKQVAERDRAHAESRYRALVRAERRGRRKVATELARRAALFNTKFQGFKEAQDDVCDFRECRGSVASFWKSQDADFSFLPEIAIMSGLMDGYVHAETRVPPIEGRIRQLWEPIEVYEDTAEAGAGVGDPEGIAAEEGEVDQPVSSFGVSMSCFLDL